MSGSGIKSVLVFGYHVARWGALHAIFHIQHFFGGPTEDGATSLKTSALASAGGTDCNLACRNSLKIAYQQYYEVINILKLKLYNIDIYYNVYSFE